VARRRPPGTPQPPGLTAARGRPARVVQVEYGETADESTGAAIVATLRLINNLEINEQILYPRMENMEESTLEI
jgi:hypothetical protein